MQMTVKPKECNGPGRSDRYPNWLDYEKKRDEGKNGHTAATTMMEVDGFEGTGEGDGGERRKEATAWA